MFPSGKLCRFLSPAESPVQEPEPFSSIRLPLKDPLHFSTLAQTYSPDVLLPTDMPLHFLYKI